MGQKLIELKVLDKRLYVHGLPAYATMGSAGVDLRAAVGAPITVQPHQTVLVPSGIAVHIDDDKLVGLLFPRSGLASNHGIMLANSVGVLDADYQGEIKLAVHNLIDTPYEIQPFDRIAQLLFVQIAQAQFKVVPDFTPTARGAGGFGHTGKN